MTHDEIDPDLAALIESAEMERTVHPDESHIERTKRILEEAAPVAAMSIVQLSRQAANENLRYRASTYILDRVLGVEKGASGIKPVWEEVFEGVVIPDDVSSIDKRA